MKVNVHVFDNIRVSNIFTLRNVYLFFLTYSLLKGLVLRIKMKFLLSGAIIEIL